MKTFYTPRTAAAVIIANMVGTGVFTSLGFQLVDIQSVFAIMMLWIIGGVASLCGAATYAELGAALPRSGGEYNFLGRIYHPVAGFISGWVSAVIGFAAPIAAVALAFGKYSTAALPGEYAPWAGKALACGLVILVTLVHGRNRKASGQFQFSFTAVKVILILTFCLAVFAFTSNPQPISPMPQAGDWDVMTSAAFGVSLIYVAYAYTGWNAAVYISGELENPQKDLPRILIFGTGLVMLLYVLLNYVFLYAAPMAEMEGQVEIGYIAAKGIFGETGARIAGGMLSLLLISFLAILGVFILRWKEPDLPRPYKTWGYPIVPLVYLAITSAMLIFVVIEEPHKAVFGACVIAVGAVFYLVSARLNRE